MATTFVAVTVTTAIVIIVDRAILLISQNIIITTTTTITALQKEILMVNVCIIVDLLQNLRISQHLHQHRCLFTTRLRAHIQIAQFLTPLSLLHIHLRITLRHHHFADEAAHNTMEGQEKEEKEKPQVEAAHKAEREQENRYQGLHTFLVHRCLEEGRVIYGLLDSAEHSRGNPLVEEENKRKVISGHHLLHQ